MRRSPNPIGRILAVLLAGVLLSRWELIRLLGSPAWTLSGAAPLLFLVLLLGSLVGLLMPRRWGFYCAYLLVVVSTFLLGIALVPFVTGLLPSATLRTWAVVLLNAAFLAATMVAHRQYQRTLDGRLQPARPGR